MTRVSVTTIAAALLVLLITWTTSFAAKIPVSMTWEGTVIETAIDVNEDGFVANLINAQTRGSFGAASTGVLTEFIPVGLCDDDPNVVYWTVFYSRPVTTYSNGDQLWGNVFSGWMCLNVATGDFSGVVEGEYTGGTGRFAGATGSFVVDFSGNNITVSDLGVGFGAIRGENRGTLVLP